VTKDVEAKPAGTIGINELLVDPNPLPLIAPFISGTPVITPDGEAGNVVSDTMILEGSDGKGGSRKYIASYWQEARMHVARGANLCDESTLRVRSKGRIRRFPAGDLRVVARPDLASTDEP